MKTILTLTVGEFHFVDDLLLLALIMTGTFGFLFLKNSSLLSGPCWSRKRLALDLTGMAATITSFCFFWLNRSWNNAFELAGNSYAVSGHLFREDYRYVAWFLTTPLLLTALITALPLEKTQWRFLLFRLIISSVVLISSDYFIKMQKEAQEIFASLSSYFCMAAAFFYIVSLFWKNIPQQFTSNTSSAVPLFLKARRLLLISWMMHPFIDFLSSRSSFSNSTGVILMITAYTLIDVILPCGIGFYIYELLKAQEQ